MTTPGAAALIADREHPVTVHVVGIGGAGMSAIATALHAMGHGSPAVTSKPRG